MRPFSIWPVLTLLVLIPSAVAADPSDNAETAADEKLLETEKIAIDGPGLLDFFRKRTGKDPELERIAGLIRQLGDDTFRAREKAAAELKALGPPALAQLRLALNHPDEEIKDRARVCIAAIEDDRKPELAEGAARLLRVRRPAGASAVLLAYLPFAESALVEDEVLLTLIVLADCDGKIDPATEPALKSPLAERRAAAALVLGRSGTVDQKTAVRALLKDADARVRLRAAPICSNKPMPRKRNEEGRPRGRRAAQGFSGVTVKEGIERGKQPG